jgi:CelD/BcsL family acetyltransferase involved in cellulose biosynthesis
MKVTIQTISDPSRILGIRDVWDRFLQRHSDNPFLLSGFIVQYMDDARSLDWTPLVMLISVDEALVGLVPLMTRKKFGIRHVKSLPLCYFSDFACVDDYREVVISKTIDFLFRGLNCQLASFVLPAESPFVKLLTRECRKMRIRSTQSMDLGGAMGRAVLLLQGSWQQYAKSRGKKFSQDIRRAERNLAAIGRWRVVRLSAHEQHDPFEQIACIERMSWKMPERTRKGQQVDPNMLNVWRGLLQSSPIQPGADWYVYFLQLNSSMIAYVLVVEFKGIVFPVFTSYDQHYARLGPSIYLMNMLIRDSFEKRCATKIDFLSDVPFTRTWTSTCLKRVMFMMTPKGSLTQIIAILYPRGLSRLYETITRRLQLLLGPAASRALRVVMDAETVSKTPTY